MLFFLTQIVEHSYRQIMVQQMNFSFRLQPNEKQHNHKAVQNLRVYKGVTRTGCWQAAWERFRVVRFKSEVRPASEYIPAFTNSRNTVRLMYGKI